MVGSFQPQCCARSWAARFRLIPAAHFRKQLYGPKLVRHSNLTNPQVRLNLADMGQAIDTVTDSSPEQGIRQTIGGAGRQRALKIDLSTPWWSTRLYLTSALAEQIAAEHIENTPIPRASRCSSLV